MRATPSRPPLRHLLLGMVAVIAMLGVACGDDSGGSSKEAFCKVAKEQDAADSLDVDNPDDVETMNALVEIAPGEIKEAMRSLRDLALEFNEVDETDPDSFEAAFEIFANPKFLGAVQDVSIYMADECGLDVDGIDQIREIDPDDPSSLLEGVGAGQSE